MIQVNILLVPITILLLVLAYSAPVLTDTPPESESETKKSLACQYTAVNITCDPGFYIDVISANYGRLSKTICKSDQMLSTSCSSKTSLDVVRTKCNNEQNCTVSATNDIFGNPCPNTIKYLDVRYQCIAKPSVKSEIACEGSNVNAKCEVGEAVSVQSSKYGQTLSKVCKDGALIDSKDCFSQNSTKVVTNYCLSKQNCSIPATDQVFEDPCDGTSKYLEVEYECVKSRKQLIACQYSTLNIKCDTGFVVDVIRADYGRHTNTTCEAFEMATTDCSAKTSYDIVHTKCTDQQSCSISATNDVFGNPCVSTIKYLDVEYQCIPKK